MKVVLYLLAHSTTKVAVRMTVMGLATLAIMRLQFPNCGIHSNAASKLKVFISII